MTAFLYDILPSSTQSVQFDWISIVYLALVVLFLILGLKEGFAGALLGFLGVILSAFVSYFVCKPFGTWLSQQNGWGASLIQQIYDFLASKSEYASQVLDRSQAESVLPTALGAMGIPSFLNAYIIKAVLATIPESGASSAIGIYIAQAISPMIWESVAYLICFIVIDIVIALLHALVRKGRKASKTFRWWDTLLGGILGLGEGCLVVVGVSFGLAAISANGQIYSYLDSVLHLTDDSVWTLGKMLFEQNFLLRLLGYVGIAV
jgi:uncharacterized membrane protein required for colicin V production